MDEFEVYLVSNGSMELYPNNTLSSFTNRLSEPLDLKGNWKVALTSISIPSTVKNVTTTKFVGYNYDKENKVIYKDIYDFQSGIYPSVEDLLIALQKQSLTKVMRKTHVNPADGKLSLQLKANEAFMFYDAEIPNILGLDYTEKFFNHVFKYIGHDNIDKLDSTILNHSLEGTDEDDTITITGQHPVDITYDINHVFVYINIIEYQHVADTKAPLLRVFNRGVRLKNGSIQQIETQTGNTFKDLEFKKILSNNIQSIKIELRTESGRLVPFVGTGRTTLTLKFKKVS